MNKFTAEVKKKKNTVTHKLLSFLNSLS